jgi:hypothetical protein
MSSLGYLFAGQAFEALKDRKMDPRKVNGGRVSRP